MFEYSIVKMSRNALPTIALVMAAAVAAQAGVLSVKSSSEVKPFNVLFLCVDDLKPLIGAYGNTVVKTPNIDRLARQGRIFLNAQCQQPICTPSRTSFLTGLYPEAVGVVDLETPMRGVHPDIITLPQHFRQNGYVTAGLGKIFDSRNVDKGADERSWSIPFGERHQPLEFDPSPPVGYYQNPQTADLFRQLNRQIKERGLSWKESRKLVRASPGSSPPTEAMDVPDAAYTDGAIARNAVKLLDELAASRQPFFLAVGFYKPHLPFVAPKKYWDIYRREDITLPSIRSMPKEAPEIGFQDSWELRSYSDIPAAGPLAEDLQRELIHGYLACVSYVDAQIGIVLDRRESLGLASSTMVVLLGDHGWHLGDHGMWCKHTNYEQAVRSPLIIAVPGMRDPGKPADGVVGFVDIYPTLCDLARLPLPAHLQGFSLRPVLDDPAAKVKEYELSQMPREHGEDDYMGYTLRDSRYRYVAWLKSRNANDTHTPISEPTWTELDDLHKDPDETINLANHPDYAALVGKFSTQLAEKLRSIRPGQ